RPPCRLPHRRPHGRRPNHQQRPPRPLAARPQRSPHQQPHALRRPRRRRKRFPMVDPRTNQTQKPTPTPIPKTTKTQKPTTPKPTNRSLEPPDLRATLGLPTITFRRALEDLAAYQLVQRIKGSSGKADRWKVP